ncbi:MAG: hypothetical protein K4571_18130 [Deltaproteobacteria bacterium]
MKNMNWKYFIIILLAIPVVSYIGKTVGENAAIKQNEKENNYNVQNSSVESIKVFVTTQDAGGAIEQQMDMNFLRNLENYTAERLKTNINKSLESKGISAGDLNIKSESVYVESGGKKFAVIRHKGPDKLVSVIVLSIVGSKLKRVTCLSQNSDSIPIAYGVCGNKIKEVFGVSIGG